MLLTYVPCKDPKSDFPGIFHLLLVQLHCFVNSQSSGLWEMQRCNCDKTQGCLLGRQNLGTPPVFILTWGAGKSSTTLAIHSHCRQREKQAVKQEDSQPDVPTSDLLLTRMSANTRRVAHYPLFLLCKVGLRRDPS